MAFAHTILTVVLYVLAILLGFAVSISLGVVQAQYGNLCILYATVDWTKPVYMPVNLHICNFNIYEQVFGGIIFPVLFILYHGCVLRKRNNNPQACEDMWVLPFLVYNVVNAFMVLISSFVITIGFKSFCDNFSNSPNPFVTSCKQAQGFVRFKVDGVYQHVYYYNWLVAAQIGTWASLLVWCSLASVAIHRFFRNRRQHAKGPTCQDVSTISNEQCIN